MGKMLYLSDASVWAYEKAAHFDQSSLGYAYWVGVAQALYNVQSTAPTASTSPRIDEDFFKTLPPYLEGEKRAAANGEVLDEIKKI